MTTSEHRPAKPPPLLGVSPLELRLYIAAVLAIVYTLAWRAIGGHAPAAEPVATTAPITDDAAPPRYVWLDTLPPASRPAIAVPSGWQIADGSAPALAPAPAAASAPPSRVVRAPAPAPTRRVHRVRTRSS